MKIIILMEIKLLRVKNNMKPLNKEEFSDISSNYSNLGNREMLIQNKNKKVIEQTRNYISQSFLLIKIKLIIY